MALNKKGQAAITDALYFLLIVSALCVLLFAFSMNFGRTAFEQGERQFGTEYASSAFKTIFYSSIPRIERESLESSPEADYLLAAIKEDYADNAQLDRTKRVVANNIAGIMEPLQDNYDYVFYIYAYPTDCGQSGTTINFDNCGQAGATEHVFTMFSLHTTVGTGGNASRELFVFLCNPQNQNFLDNLYLLLEKVGSVSKASSFMRLPRLDPQNSRLSNTIAAEVNLAMWVSSDVSETEFNALSCTACWKKTRVEGANWEALSAPECN